VRSSGAARHSTPLDRSPVVLQRRPGSVAARGKAQQPEHVESPRDRHPPSAITSVGIGGEPVSALRVMQFCAIVDPIRPSVEGSCDAIRVGSTEGRCQTFGVSNPGRLLVVSHTESGNVLRIISARQAAKGERRIYEEG